MNRSSLALLALVLALPACAEPELPLSRGPTDPSNPSAPETPFSTAAPPVGPTAPSASVAPASPPHVHHHPGTP